MTHMNENENVKANEVPADTQELLNTIAELKKRPSVEDYNRAIERNTLYAKALAENSTASYQDNNTQDAQPSIDELRQTLADCRKNGASNKKIWSTVVDLCDAEIAAGRPNPLAAQGIEGADKYAIEDANDLLETMREIVNNSEDDPAFNRELSKYM